MEEGERHGKAGGGLVIRGEGGIGKLQSKLVVVAIRRPPRERHGKVLLKGARFRRCGVRAAAR